MSDEWQAIDANERGSLTAVSTADDRTIVRLVADPITGALVVTTTGPVGNNFVYNEVVAGSGTSWTLANTPVSNTQAIYANGQRLIPGGVDYSITGAAITTVLSWTAGTVLADYQYA